VVHGKGWKLLVLAIKYIVFTEAYHVCLFLCVHMYILKVVCKNHIYVFLVMGCRGGIILQ